MITQAILSIYYSMTNGLINLMPTFSVQQEVINGAQSFLQSMANINQIFPINTLITCLGIIIGYHMFTLGFYIVNWVIRKVPTVS